ncbi:MAG: hypothetical protein KME16_12955 [Scytolyngbya sp. HA4215-MV1]|nr:hypothetical protein [Scytolyngbya sp. HA4215-MV1]
MSRNPLSTTGQADKVFGFNSKVSQVFSNLPNAETTAGGREALRLGNAA